MKRHLKSIFKSFRIIIASNVCVAVLGTTVLGASIGEVKKSVNVRKTPYDVGTVVGALYPGEKVTIQKNNNGWYYVSKDGKAIGWVSGDYINVTASKSNVVNKTQTKVVASKSVNAKSSSSTTAITATNVRNAPNANAKLVTAIYKGDKVTALEKVGDWYKIKLSNNTVGYIMGKYINTANLNVNAAKAPTTVAKATKKTTTKVAVKTVAKVVPKSNVVQNYTIAKAGKSNLSVNVRQNPDKNGKVLASSSAGNTFSVLGKVNDWYKVKLQNNTVGYVLSSYVTIGNFKFANRGGYAAPAAKQATTQATAKVAVATTADTSTRTSKAVSIIDFGKKYLGTQYVYGGTTPSGFDCSGFVLYVCSHFGINLPRTAQEQATVGTSVSKSDLSTGDLVFFDTSGNNSGNICHVGIYIGNGQFIHSSSGGGHVMISDLTSGFYASAYVKAKRVF